MKDNVQDVVDRLLEGPGGGDRIVIELSVGDELLSCDVLIKPKTNAKAFAKSLLKKLVADLKTNPKVHDAFDNDPADEDRAPHPGARDRKPPDDPNTRFVAT